jgi:hypothetical protein
MLTKSQKRKERRKRRQQRKRELNRLRFGRIRRTYTTVDVQWQDGTHTKGLSSTSLIPRNFIQDTEYYPEDFVTLKLNSDSTHRTFHFSFSHFFTSFSRARVLSFFKKKRTELWRCAQRMDSHHRNVLEWCVL